MIEIIKKVDLPAPNFAEMAENNPRSIFAESIRRAAVLPAKLHQPRRDERPEEAGRPPATAGRGQGPHHSAAAAPARGGRQQVRIV